MNGPHMHFVIWSKTVTRLTVYIPKPINPPKTKPRFVLTYRTTFSILRTSNCFKQIFSYTRKFVQCLEYLSSSCWHSYQPRLRSAQGPGNCLTNMIACLVIVNYHNPEQGASHSRPLGQSLNICLNNYFTVRPCINIKFYHLIVSNNIFSFGVICTRLYIINYLTDYYVSRLPRSWFYLFHLTQFNDYLQGYSAQTCLIVISVKQSSINLNWFRPFSSVNIRFWGIVHPVCVSLWHWIGSTY